MASLKRETALRERNVLQIRGVTRFRMAQREREREKKKRNASYLDKRRCTENTRFRHDSPTFYLSAVLCAVFSNYPKAGSSSRDPRMTSMFRRGTIDLCHVLPVVARRWTRMRRPRNATLGRGKAPQDTQSPRERWQGSFWTSSGQEGAERCLWLEDLSHLR